MSESVLDKNLREYKWDDAVRAMARARTLAVLRSLDGNRKAQVVRFLYELGLIGKVDESWVEGSWKERGIGAIIDLRIADLTGVDLFAANLRGANLRTVSLIGANLSYADLSDADLGNTNLSYADLGGVDLFRANLRNANLMNAKNCDDPHLARAESLVGATLPDGREIKSELDWLLFKKPYLQKPIQVTQLPDTPRNFYSHYGEYSD